MSQVIPAAYSLPGPILGTATAVLAATASVVASTVSAGITQPDVPRNVIATPGGTTGNVLAVSVVVTGTDIYGNALTETLPAFTAGASTAVTGVKAFKTINSISLPANGAATTIAIGTGTKLGVPWMMAANYIYACYFNNVLEATAATVTTSTTDVSKNTVSLNSALNGSVVDVSALLFSR